MPENFKNFIAGDWVAPTTGAYFENRNPADWDDVIGCFPRSGPEDVALAVASAQRGFATWSRTPAPIRGEVLHRVGDLLVQRKEVIARAMTREMGKVLAETRGDVQEGIDTAYYAHTEGRRLFGRTVPSELRNKWAMSFRRPIGVAGLITPFNFPLAIPTWKMFPALLCGNAVLFKPAEDVPLTAHLLVEILLAAGLPPEVVQLVHEMSREWHVLGRLEEHGITAQQRREHLPRGDCQREVEWRDQPGDPDRPAEAHRPLVAQLRWDRAAEQPAAFGMGVIRGVDPLLHVAPRLGEHLAHLARHGARDLLLALHQQVAHAVQHLAADRRGRPAPGGKTTLGRRDGQGHVLGTGAWEAADHVVPVGGVAVLEVRTRRRGDPIAGDEVLEVLRHGERCRVSGAECPRCQCGWGMSGHSHKDATLASPTRGSTSRVMSNTPQTIRICETTCATPMRRLHAAMLAHRPVAMTVATPIR